MALSFLSDSICLHVLNRAQFIQSPFSFFSFIFKKHFLKAGRYWWHATVTALLQDEEVGRCVI